jgi:hypothetical protein
MGGSFLSDVHIVSRKYIYVCIHVHVCGSWVRVRTCFRLCFENYK